MNKKSSHFGIYRRKQQKTQYLKEKNNILWTQITTRTMEFFWKPTKKHQKTSLLGKVQPVQMISGGGATDGDAQREVGEPKFRIFQRKFGCWTKNRGTPKRMVKILENPIKIDDLGGPPLFLETPIWIFDMQWSKA